MTKKTLTAKFTLMLVAVLMFVFAGVFCASIFSDGMGNGLNELNVADATMPSLTNATKAGQTYTLENDLANGGSCILESSNWKKADDSNCSVSLVKYGSRDRNTRGWGFADIDNRNKAICYLIIPLGDNIINALANGVNVGVSIKFTIRASSNTPYATASLFNREPNNVSSCFGERATKWSSIPNNSIANTHGTNEWYSSYPKSDVVLGSSTTYIGKDTTALYLSLIVAGRGINDQVCFDKISITFYFESSISVSKSPSDAGKISDTSVSFDNLSEEKTLTATDNSSDKYYFVNWTNAGNEVSKSSSYKFYGYNYPSGTNLVANWTELGFTFDGINYSTFDPSTQLLRILQANTSSDYLKAYGLRSGLTGSVQFKNSSNADISKPTTIGTYKAIISAKDGDTVYGTRTIDFSIVDGDFGHLTSGASGLWGSQTNPYVISTLAHLNNLANIVNGKSDALNSIVGSDHGRVTSETVVAKDTTYTGCYFVVKDSIIADSEFSPIGKDSNHAFSGTFYGGTGVYGSFTNMTITLNMDLSSSSYVGLFGYTNCATIEYITTSGTVKGKNFVGGVVGYANASFIKNVINTANVTGSGSNVGGIAGYATGYQILDKVSFTGSQYLNTGVMGGATWNFDIQFTNTTQRQLMGYSTSGANYWGVEESGYYGVYATDSIGKKAGGRDHIEWIYTSSLCKLTANGTETKTYPYSDVSSLYMCLGNLGSATAGYKCYCDLYSLTCSQNGVQIRDFIPVRRMSDGVVGLFDKINNTFYTPSVGALVGGDVVSYPEICENCENSGSIKGDTCVGGIIGSNGSIQRYQFLEKVSFTGSQGLDTGVVGDATWNFDMQWTVTKTRQLLGYGGSGSEYWGVPEDGGYGLFEGSTIGAAGNRDKIEWIYTSTTQKLIINNNLTKLLGYTDVSANSMYLGNLKGYTQYYCTFDLYSLSCSQNGTVVRDFIPAKRLSDGKIGLFDRINYVFYLPDVGTLTGTEMAGYCNLCKSCKNTASISGTSDIGGIVGRTNGSISNVYNSGAVQASSLATYGDGGIAAYSSGSISYAYNTGDIEFNDATGQKRSGGIVGIYDGTSLNFVYNDTSNGNNNKSIYGTATNISSAQKAWNIGSAKVSDNTFGVEFGTGVTFNPGSGSAWTNIVSTNIESFKLSTTTSDGTYFALANDSNAYAVPTSLTNSTRAGNESSYRAANAIAYEIEAVYNFASLSPTSIKASLNNITVDDDIKTGSSKVFDKSAVTFSTKENIVPTNYTQETVINGAGPVLDAGTYNINLNILAGGKVVGTYHIVYTISPKDISNNADPSRIVFKYLGNVSNNTKTNDYYRLNASYDVSIKNQVRYLDTPAIIYDADSTYNADSFAIYDGDTKLNRTGSVIDIEVSALKHLTGTDGILKPTGQSDPTVTITGKGNYTGSYKVWFTIMKSDFDRKSSGVSGVWGSENNPYVISAFEHMLRLTDIVSGRTTAWDSIVGVNKIPDTMATAKEKSYYGCYFEVSANLNLTKTMGFIPVGLNDAGQPSATPFKATQFNGNNHTITITYDGSGTDYIGIFAYVQGTNFVNIKTAGSVSGQGYVGALAGYLEGRLNGTIDNSATVTGTRDYIGGIVGEWIEYSQTDSSTISGTNSGDISGANKVGGFAGFINGADSSRNDRGGTNANVVFFEYHNTGAVTATTDYAGGITGWVYNDFTGATNGVKVFYTGCTNTASINGRNFVGGITGHTRDGKFYGCVNGTSGTSAKIKATGNYAGGIMANGNFNTTIGPGTTYANSVNINYMAVSGVNYVGGISGHNEWTVFLDVKNYGSVTASEDYAGGIVGRYEIDSSLYTVTGAYNEGAVSGRNYVGGIIGSTKEYNNNSAYVCQINSAQNRGAIIGASYVGGIVGRTVTAVAYAGTVINQARITATGSYAGGIAGYSKDSNINGVTLRNTAIIQGSSASDYIGGLFGYLTLSAAATSGNFETYGTYIGYSYVGGIAGYFNTNSKAVTGKFISGTTYSGTDYHSGNSVITSGGFFGSHIFGYCEGNSTVTFSSGTLIAGKNESNTDASGATIYPGGVIGGIAGANINLVLDLRNSGNFIDSSYQVLSTTSTNSSTISADLISSIAGDNHINCIGGICGYNNGTVYLPTSALMISEVIRPRSNYPTNASKYIGGIVAYNDDNGVIENVNFSFARIGWSSSESNNNNRYNGSYVGGIAGYNKGTVNNIISVSGDVYGFDYVGGFFGYNTNELTFAPESVFTHTGIVNGIGTTGYVGGFAGYTSARISLKNFTQSGAVTSSGSYVGGIFGYAEDAALNTVSYTVSAISGVSYVGGIAGYLRLQSIASNPDSITTQAVVSATGSFVGGYAGFMTVDNSGIFTSFTPVLKKGTSFTVQGKSFVGGLFGYFAGGGYKVSQSTALSTDTVIHISADNVNLVVSSTSDAGEVIGGLFGYVARAGIVFDTSWNTSYAFNATASALSLNINDSYFGGIAGILGENAAIEWNASSVTNTNTIIENNLTITSTGSYIGGIAGYVSPYAGAYAQAGVYNIGKLINLKNGSPISGASFVGGFFGAVGDSKDEIIINTSSVEITNTIYMIHRFSELSEPVQSETLPSGTGYSEDKVCYTVTTSTSTVHGEEEDEEVTEYTFHKYYYKSISSYTASNYTSYVEPTMAEAVFIKQVDDSYTNFIYSVTIGTGQYSTTTTETPTGKTEFEKLESHKNDTSITNTQYEYQFGTIENKGKKVSGDNNYFVFEPGYAVNLKSITASGSYAGGFVGYAGTHARLSLVNSQVIETSDDTNIISRLKIYNSLSDSTAAITAASYAGGFAGYLGKEQHTFTNLINNAKVGLAASTYVGGLVGYADAGIFTGCVSVKVLESTYLGADYVGGLIGYLDNGTVESCFTEGFAYFDPISSETNTTYSKGGVIGYAGSASVINNSWTFYTASGISYEDNSANTYGRYVLIETENTIQTIPSVTELCVMSGLLKDTALNSARASGSDSRVKAAKNYVSFSLNVEGVPVNNQIAFYGTSGLDEVYLPFEQGKYDNTLFEVSSILYVKLSAQSDSIIIDTVPITFRDIPLSTGAKTITQETTGDGDVDKFISSFSRPSSYDGYNLNTFTAVYVQNGDNENQGKISTYEGTTAISLGGTYYQTGRFDKTAVDGSEETPFIISDAGTWIALANKSTYSGQIVRVTADFSISANQLMTNLFGSSTTPFSGTFDGDGHRITITDTFTFTAERNSVFPSAKGTIKNLTIAASNAMQGSNLTNIAVFVGQPSGNLTIENCTNEASITGANSDVGGFVGFSGANNKISLITCVNKGNIASTRYDSTNDKADMAFGTGGVIGRISGTTTMTLDSCKNEGEIRAPQDVGGICGVSHNTLEINNCANTGNIYSFTNFPNFKTQDPETGDSEEGSYRTYSNAGGIIGKLSGSGLLRMYASYNSGTITAYGSIAGGLIGSVGDFTVGAELTFGRQVDRTSSVSKSYISYCYNTGLVQTGGTKGLYAREVLTDKTNCQGTIVGGIAGLLGPSHVSYCYNAGRIISWGTAVYGARQYHYRMGGIAGQACAQSETLNTHIEYCYNVGHIEGRSPGWYGLVRGDVKWNNDFQYYGAGIIGYIPDPFSQGGASVDYTTTNNTYSLKNSIYQIRTSGSTKWMDAGYAFNEITNQNHRRIPGTMCTLDEMTAYMNGGSLELKNSGGTTIYANSGVESLICSDSDPQYLNGTKPGWIYVYGCLPQLAVFAVDTKEGLAMRSKTYGQDIYGAWHQYTAGAELSPYVVKDGIDLLGVQALTNAGYNFNDKYISYANISNNINDIASEYINLAYNTSGEYARSSSEPYTLDMSSCKNYTYQDQNGNTARGKSYQLYAYGAVCSDIPGAGAGTAYGIWKNKNTKYNGSSWVTGVPITDVNFYPIGSSEAKYFAGTFDGTQVNAVTSGTQVTYQKKGNTIVRNAKIFNPTIAGLFGYIQNGTVSNTTLDGEVKAMVKSSDMKAIAGMVAIASGSSNLDGLVAGSEKNKLSILTEITSDSYMSYSGGILGAALSGIYSGSTWSIGSGLSLIVQNCVSNATVTTAKSYAGGILGFASNAITSTANTGNQVFLIDNNVKSGTITVSAKASTLNQDYGTAIGGIAGASDGMVNLSIQGCTTGSSEYTSVSTPNVTIIGENRVGGIIGYASTRVIIGAATANANVVYGDTRIARGNSWGTVSNNGEYGTSIGGFAGYSEPSAGSGSAALIFAGNNEFYGHILISIATGDGTRTVEAVGGLAGYLGSGSEFREGSNITVGGTIEIASSIASQNSIGGVAGIANGAAFSGKFTVSSIIIAEKSNKIGGFIGTSKGQTEILAGKASTDTGSDITIAANITAVSEVGGFVGEIEEGSSLNIGSDIYATVPYNGTLKINITNAATILATGNTDGEANVGGIVGLNDGSIKVIKGTISNNGEVVGGSTLPNGYTALEYIQTTGSQYINTNYVPTNNSGFEIVLSPQNITTDSVYIGQRPSTEGRMWVGSNAGDFYFGWNTNIYAKASVGSLTVATDRTYTFGLNFRNNRTRTVNGTDFGGTLGTLVSTTYPIIIGAGYNNGTIGLQNKCKIYSVKITEGNSVTMNLVPCKDSSGTAGLYDTIGKTFYTNAGSGTFTVGSAGASGEKADNAGGFIGQNAGDISFDRPVITNSGTIIGGDNIGGIIGYLKQGTIAGTFTNSGAVSGLTFVGGSVGRADGDTVFTTPTHQDGATVTPTADTLFKNEGVVSGSSYVAGSVGGFFGEIKGYSDYLVNFVNSGIVTTGDDESARYIGGSFGVLAGKADYASFDNAGIIDSDGVTSIGGSIGLIGVPVEFAEEDHQVVEITNCHFEFTSESGINVGPGEYDSNNEGGVGGIIGVLYNVGKFDETNSFFVLGSVYAPYLDYVGGSIGVIHGGNAITINGLLAYKSTVEGYQNVGGIIGGIRNNSGVTISNSYNVSIGGQGGVVANIAKGKVYGGIVGLSPDTTEADTSYWVKGFPNEQLATLNINNVKNVGHYDVNVVVETFSGHYSPAGDVYVSYKDGITYYEQRETYAEASGVTSSNYIYYYIKTGENTYTEAGGASSSYNSETTYYEKTYEYSVASGVSASNYRNYYVDRYELTSSYVDSHVIDEYLAATGQQALATSVTSWEEYISARYPAKVHNMTIYLDGNRNWVEMVEDGEAYTTGIKSTGYYFLYASDTGISVSHEESPAGTYPTGTYTKFDVSDIDFWKRIANSYTTAEIEAGKNTDAIRSEIAPDLYPIGATKTDVQTVKAGGEVESRHLYARAASNYRDGFFLYMKSSTNEGIDPYHDTNTNSTDFFVTVDLEQGPQNVVLFYRSVEMGSSLTYNGNERFAPITLNSDEIGYLETVSNVLDDSKVSKYYYTVRAGSSGIDGKTPAYKATDVGNYVADIVLYYYDATGHPYEVGSIINGEWSITPRQLKMTAKQKGVAVYNGTATTGDVEVAIDNFCVADKENATIQIVFTADETSILKDEFVFTYQLGTQISPSGGHTTSKYIAPKGTIELTTKSMSGNAETGYNLKEDAENKTYSAKLNFTFTNALKYKVTVNTFAGIAGHETLVNDYIVPEVEAEVEVQARTLHVGDTSTDTSGNNISALSKQYNGAPFTKNIFITGWAASDSNKVNREKWFMEFFPYWTDENGNVTYFKLSTNGGSSTDSTKSLVTDSNGSYVTIQGENKGTYNFGFNSSKSTSGTPGTSTTYIFTNDGNYKIQLSPNPQPALVIAENALTLTWSGANKTYNGSGITVTATIKSTYDLADTSTWNTLLSTYLFTMASKTANNVKENACVVSELLPQSKDECKITFTTNKNADTYVAKITGPDQANINANCPLTTTTSGTESSRSIWTDEVTISKKALTVNYTQEGVSPYIYNTSHQGVTLVYLTGFVSGENIENTGSYGKENGTQINKTSGISSTYSKSDDGYTITGGAVNVGTYSVGIRISAANSNYSVSTANKEWKIDKYEITLGTGGTTTSVYNGRIQSIEAVYNDPNLKPGSTTAKRKYYTDEVEISFLYATSGGESANDVCNVGTYTITINSVNSVSAKNKSGNDVSFNYSVKDSTAYTATHTITPVAVSVTFSAPSTFVYNTKEQGPVIATATITTATGNVTKSATAAADFKSAKFAGLYGTEEITVTVINSGNKDANTYRATATSITAGGNNEAGLTNTANYTFTTATKDYEIQKSRIKVTIAPENVSAITKVYDRTTSASVDSTAFTLSSVNGGAALPASALSDNSGTANPQPGIIYGTYDTKDVGTGKTVTFSVKNTSVQNYIFENDSNEYSGLEIKTGVITRAAVVISMNLSRNKAVKTYDGTNEYAVFENGNANNRSVKYKSGQGFTVSGVLAGDDLIISAEFREADKSRSYFDAFINNVTREGSEGSYTYSKTTDTYKCLVFTVKSSSGNDFMNYSVMIDRFTSLQPITSSSNEANVIYLYDSSDSDASHKNADTSSVIGIEISAKTITATYENTTQSYANDDNSFNMMWKAVTGDSSGIITGDGVTFAMINGWMYENGADRHANTPGVDITQEEIDAGIVKKYIRYTTVRGTSSSTSLRATLVSTNGKHLNYVLRQQPTLTIGYFVNQNGYEINSFAGLMLATYYYSTNFMETSLADDDINTATLVNTWNLIKNSTGATCSWEDYENNVNIPTDLGSCTTWDDYFDKFITKYNKDITDEQLKIEEIIYEDGSATGAAAGWGYWVNIKQARTSYLKFKQTKNITAVLSDNDIAILNGQFGSDWGLGTQYLSNFIKCSAGEVCVAVNAVFPVIKVDSRYYGFLGEYYGNGFVIDNLTIMANNASSFSYGSGSLYTAPQYGEVTGGIGMFALVNSSPLPSFSTISGTQNGYVTAVNIRNAVITVSDLRGGAASDVLYAGGLIGVSQMTGTLVNSSFHGTIVASSSGAGLTVGGLIGLYSQPSSDISEIVKGSIISGAVHVYGKTNVETGALIGRVNGTSTNAVIADIVSVSEIIATVTSDTANYIGALVGYAGNVSSSFVSSVSNTIAYLTNSTLKVVGNSESLLNKAVGSASADSYGVSYTTLRSGTNTAYNASGVFDPVSMPSGGTYDVMDKVVVLGTNDLISTRLGDIIDIYVLLFTLSEGSRTDGTNTIPVTTKLSTSPLIGKKLGTATSRIPVNNQQQAALLRMVPFAEFELKSNVKMYSTHKAEPYNGFFHGTITGSYTIDLIYATSSANAGKMFRWESGTSLPCISTVPEEAQS